MWGYVRLGARRVVKVPRQWRTRRFAWKWRKSSERKMQHQHKIFPIIKRLSVQTFPLQNEKLDLVPDCRDLSPQAVTEPPTHLSAVVGQMGPPSPFFPPSAKGKRIINENPR